MQIEDYNANAQNFSTGCLVGVPTLGVVPAEFALSMISMLTPLNWRGAVHFQYGLAVDAARNAIVQRALDQNSRWVFFRDDDVFAPADCLTKLYHLQVPIAAGVVWGKVWPTDPMMFKWADVAGYRDWQFGDVVEVDWTGMGCTLIHTDVFKAIEPPWFQTEPGRMVKDKAGNEYTMGHTEDAYFYRKAEAAGFKPVVDTSIQTVHFDVAGGKRYLWHNALNTPTVQHPDGQCWMYPTFAERKELPVREPTAPIEGPVKFNLGCGQAAGMRDGYINVDLHGESADENLDCRRIGQLTKKYGLADEVYCSHLLEHFRVEEIPGIIRDWVDALKPGGLLWMEMPDFRWACEQWLSTPEDDPEKYHRKMYEIFGLSGNGMEHKCGITKELLMSLLTTLPLENIEITVLPAGTQMKGLPVGTTLRQQDLEVRATKKEKEEV
jgi:predicted SAM-dependent methyltransferase